MELKGMDQLRKHVPQLRTPGGQLRVGLAFIAIFILTTFFFLASDRAIPEWQPDGEILVFTLGFLILAQFFRQKKKLQQKYDQLAYRNAFILFIVPGIAIIFASIAHVGYMPGPVIPDAVWWKHILTWVGWVFVIVGAALWFRTVCIFGVDNLTMLYVYFPAQGQMVDSAIYSALRHPVYAAALRLIIGLALLSANWFALVFALLSLILLTGWIRLIEEKELLERFPNYADYRKRVPAFWPRPKDTGTFFKFLLTGK